jgi:hypothetical protein
MMFTRAFLLLPNIYVHEVVGKLLFVACDLLVGYVLYQIVRLRGLPEKSEQVAMLICWWDNFLTCCGVLLWLQML